MDDSLRALLYPILGIIASLAFASRFLVQWIQSESKKRSHVPKVFWLLSIIGNTTYTLHYIIQVQYPFALLQACHITLAWRNLNLRGPLEKRASRSKVWFLLFSTVLTITLLFVLQGFLYFGHLNWVRTPIVPWSRDEYIHIALAWHLLGTMGALLFASRFWVQWWRAEKHQQSHLGRSFWWMSIIGASVTCVYALKAGDVVTLIGHSFGLIPYLRNLILLYKQRRQWSPSS